MTAAPTINGLRQVDYSEDDGATVGYFQTGTWNVTNDANGYQGNARYTAGGTGSTTAVYTFASLAAGDYQVFAHWVPFSNRATNAPYTIVDGITQRGAVTVNQQLEPADQTAAGVTWQSLGTFTSASGTLAGVAVALRGGSRKCGSSPSGSTSSITRCSSSRASSVGIGVR